MWGPGLSGRTMSVAARRQPEVGGEGGRRSPKLHPPLFSARASYWLA